MSDGDHLIPVRRVAVVALGLAYAHTVFGAIVRISGSGLGCGEHWPDCNGTFFPTVADHPAVAIEATHRFLAGALLGTTVGLLALVAMRRREPGIGGPGGVLRPAALAVALVVVAALVGMLVVQQGLHSPYTIVVHYALAMTLLATLVVAAQRAGGLGAAALAHGAPGSMRAFRGAAAAATLAFLTVVFGALTANIPGAAGACLGFPWCRTVSMEVPHWGLHVQHTHRILAFLLWLHLIGFAIGVTRRSERRPVVRAAQLSAALVTLQVLIGALLVERHLAPLLQSFHQATGTLLWIVVFALAALARRAAAPSTS